MTTILLFLLLGAIGNVAVAWGLCAFGPPWEEGTYRYLDEREGRAFWDRVVQAYLPGTERYYASRTDVFGRTMFFAKSMQVRAQDLTDVDRAAGLVILEGELDQLEYGWPRRALRTIIVRWITFDSSVLEVRVVGGIRQSDNPFSGAFPLLPIWPGFIMNTLFYAAMLWLLITGPFVLRRLIRRKRGHCIKCGYDLRGDFDAGCPECGWNREAEVTT